MSNFGPPSSLDTRSPSGASPAGKVDEQTGEITARAFIDEGQLSQFVSSLVQDSSTRNIQNGRITSKLNSERPWNPAELKEAGLSWKSNFTTRPLNTLVGKVSGRFPRSINSARYLTSASLPPTAPESEDKTNFFRLELTKFLRSEVGHEDLVNSLSHEDVLFGWVPAAALDDDDILPKPFRQDQSFVPVGTRQSADSLNAVVFRVDQNPHRAYEIYRAGKASEELTGDKRWKLDRLAEAINGALPEKQRARSASENQRQQIDLQRQLASMGTFAGSEKVTFYHILAVELSGKVSHYILDQSYRLLFEYLDRWDKMEEVVTLFAFEYGDGTLQSSKGLGRTAYAFAAVLDRARNDAVDRLQMAGKLIVQCPDNNSARLKMSVVGNIIQLNQDWNVSTTKLESSVEASVQLDSYLRALLDEMSGSVSPKSFEGRDRVTNAEVNLLSAREGERVDDGLSRWLTQFGALVTQTKRRILKSEAPRAVEFRKKLAERLTPEEISYLLSQPALTVVEDLSERERQGIIIAATEQQGNPLIDQHKLVTEKLTAQVSPDFAKRVVLPLDDPTVTAEQTRTQMLENLAIGQGMPIPVSPRDAHAVHLAGMVQLIAITADQVSSDPGQASIAKAVIDHAKQHIQMALSAKQSLPPDIQQLIPLLDQLEKELASAMVAADDSAAAQAGSGVDAGGPGMAGPPADAALGGAPAPVPPA